MANDKQDTMRCFQCGHRENQHSEDGECMAAFVVGKCNCQEFEPTHDGRIYSDDDVQAFRQGANA